MSEVPLHGPRHLSKPGVLLYASMLRLCIIPKRHKLTQRKLFCRSLFFSGTAIYVYIAIYAYTLCRALMDGVIYASRCAPLASSPPPGIEHYFFSASSYLSGPELNAIEVFEP